MENVLHLISNIGEWQPRIANLPLEAVIIVGVIVTVFQSFRQFFSNIAIDYIEGYTRQTETDIDDELLEILKEPLSWLIFLAGLWLSNLIIAEYLNSKIEQSFSGLISLSAVSTIAWIIFKAAPLLGKVLGNLALETDTQLDDLIVPYLPKLFQTIAILIVILKGGEVILGASASALIGLLGGTGITLGLLLKDIVYDWFCTIVIYSDSLYLTNDLVVVQGIEGMAKIQDIGLRSTTVNIPSKSTIQKIPNSKMITGIVENWSQRYREEGLLSIPITLKIDDITVEQTKFIIQDLKQISWKIDPLINDSKVFFSEINQNARVIKIQAFVKTNDIAIYNAAKEQFYLEILKIMERQKLEFFATIPIALLPSYDNEQMVISNK